MNGKLIENTISKFEKFTVKGIQLLIQYVKGSLLVMVLVSLELELPTQIPESSGHKKICK